MAISPNGGKVGDLKPGSLEVLQRLATADIPRIEINPGVVHRLTRCDIPLALVVERPNPYKTKHETEPHLTITDAGREELRRRSLPVRKTHTT